MWTDETKLKTDNKNYEAELSSRKNRDIMVVNVSLVVYTDWPAAIFDNEVRYRVVELEALASCDLALETKADSLAKENSDVSFS